MERRREARSPSSGPRCVLVCHGSLGGVRICAAHLVQVREALGGRRRACLQKKEGGGAPGINLI